MGAPKDLNDDEKIAVGSMCLAHLFQLVTVYIVIAGYDDTEAQQALNVKIKYALFAAISVCYAVLFGDWFMNQADWQLFAHAASDDSPARVYLWLEIEILTIPCFFVWFFIARYFYNLKCEENKLSGAAKFVKQ